MNSQGNNRLDSGETIRQLEAGKKALQGEIASLRSSHQAALKKLEARLVVEQAYQESQQRFQIIFEQSRLGNKIIASDLRILQVNQALVEMLGYDKAELEGTRIINYAHTDYQEHWRELQEHLWVRQVPSFQLETVLVKKDGSFLWCRVTSILFTDGADTLGYTILEDITLLKQLEALQQKQRRLHQQQALLEAVLEAQQEERQRIAESLHNGVGQILFAIKLNLERVTLSVLPEQNPEVHQALEKTWELLIESINETRRVSHELVPLLLKDYGLQKAIEEFCSRFAGTSIELRCYCLEERLAAPLEIAIYRISQELINNIVKHSGAARGRLEVYRHKDYVFIEAQDNGKGMTMGNDKSPREPGKGIGLRTIQDRVELLEGTLEIDSIPGKGTLVTIRLPLHFNR